MTNSKYLTLICGLQSDTKNELMLSKHPTSWRLWFYSLGLWILHVFLACLGAPISVCDVCDSRVMCPGCIPALPDDCWDILQLPTIIRKKLPVENWCNSTVQKKKLEK